MQAVEIIDQELRAKIKELSCGRTYHIVPFTNPNRKKKRKPELSTPIANRFARIGPRKYQVPPFMIVRVYFPVVALVMRGKRGLRLISVEKILEREDYERREIR
jgi:hypothetical protein